MNLCFQVAVVEIKLKLYAIYEEKTVLFNNKLFSFVFEKPFAAETSSRTLHLRDSYCKIRNVRGHQFPR